MRDRRRIKRSVFVSRDAGTCRFDSSESWVILSPIEQSIKRKIEAAGTPLKDWDINIYRGVLTGFNEAFIISGEKRNEILNNCRSEEERTKTANIIRPILRGRDIKRYAYNFADLWLINTHNGIKEKGVPPVNIEDFPAIKAHLDSFGDKLKRRADKGDTPYNLRNCAYMEDFSKQKIVWIELTDHPKFALDEKHMFLNNTIFFITGEFLKYLILFLNSKICEWYFEKICATSGAGTRRWIRLYINQLKVPFIGKSEIAEFEKIYEEKKNLSDIEFNLIIEKRFAKVFSLSEDELSFILDSNL